MTRNSKAIRTARPTADADGMISAYSMVKSIMEAGISMAGTPLAAQLTDAERTELGL